jgi:hypothetical protein
MRSKLRRATLSLAILEISIWADRTYTTCQPWHYAYRFDDLGRKVLKEDTRLTEQNPNEHLDQRAPNILWNEEVQPPMCIAILRPDKSHSEAEISGLEWYYQSLQSRRWLCVTRLLSSCLSCIMCVRWLYSSESTGLQCRGPYILPEVDFLIRIQTVI